MTDVYDTTELDNAENIYEIFIAINNLSGGLLASFLLVVLALFFTILFKGEYDFKRVLLASDFIVTLIAIMLFFLQASPIGIIILPIVALLVLVFLNLRGG